MVSGEGLILFPCLSAFERFLMRERTKDQKVMQSEQTYKRGLTRHGKHGFGIKCD
jgi:hypothetical protein